MSKNKSKWIPYAYSGPSLTLIAIIVLFPIIYTGYISLTNMNIYNWFDFRIIGFKNYKTALFVLDSGFISALVRTIGWTVLNMIFMLIIAFILASFLNYKKLKLRNVYKTILMFPWAIPGYVSILLWKTGMFNSRFGLLNQWLEALNLQGKAWLSTDLLAFISCMVVNLWLALPFMIMIMDGALQSIDTSYYESARLSGANAYQRTVLITLPLIKSVIMPSVIITIFTTFKQFDVIFLLTQQTGSKSGADIHTVLTYAYENAFITNNYGFSSAVSIVIFVILIIFSLTTRNKLKEENF